ncbi:MAG: non-ribosomal peptide synthetase [Candidatus Binatia bacterium]
MGNLSASNIHLPQEQRIIHAKCFHPTKAFVEFKKEDLEESISDRFERQVAKHPDRIAVQTANQTLTYDELNRLSNRLAWAISAQRGDDNEPIALLLENDAPMIAAMLGALKAGKIYVPLDPLLPRARATYILDDSRAGLIVTNNANIPLANELAKTTGPLLNIDELDTSLSTDPPGLPVAPDALTWILYTSGSTGQPKGVVQNHRNVLHFVMNYTNGLHLCSEDRLTILSSFSVNAGNHDIFTALLNGASLYPLNIKEVGLEPLADWLVQHEITIYHSVPTVFRHFLESLREPAQFPNLRVIRFGGEPAAKRDVELYKQFFTQDCILINRLGSTETGTVRWYFIDKETAITGNIVPIGYPVDDNEIWLLDDGGKEGGLNNIGEIAVRSRYLTPGYWRRPDLTQAAFLPDPDGGNERIYRMGDLGRRLPDGCLLHLGRKDSQVKVRGHRIELAEIEMALLHHPAVKEGVVVARAEQDGERRLVAYMLPAARPVPFVSELRAFLNERLPDYMIPSAWVFLDAFPLAPNGKVDRGALRPPSATRPELDTTFVAPRTPLEEALAGIWSEVLCLDQVGIQDSFFELGGDSLAATQVISRVIKKFDLQLPIRFLFQAPTVADMATVIAQSQSGNVSA